jgi:hypothetical protein
VTPVNVPWLRPHRTESRDPVEMLPRHFSALKPLHVSLDVIT